MKIWSMAVKDLRLLLRDRLAAFFILGFPVLMGVFFGSVMSGQSSQKSGTMRIAMVDQDHTELSQKFIKNLGRNTSLTIEPTELVEAQESVRLARRVAVVVIPAGFGATQNMFAGQAPVIRLGVDPSRQAEAGMLEGLVMQACGELLQDRFANPRQFLPDIQRQQQALLEDPTASPQTKLLVGAFFNSLSGLLEKADEVVAADENAGTESLISGGFQLAKIERLEVSAPTNRTGKPPELAKIRQAWDLSFPQAMLWGVMGCVAGFSASIARERALGTMTRLRAAPLTLNQILMGKALACFLAVLGVIALLVVLGWWLGMQPLSYTKLIVAAVATAVCFVGIMMTFAVLGKTEQSVSGIGWGLNMVMAMFGGAMIPAAFLPGFFQTLSRFSPVRWGINALEGAIWRDYSWAELTPSLAILVGIGGCCLTIGFALLRRRKD